MVCSIVRELMVTQMTAMRLRLEMPVTHKLQAFTAACACVNCVLHRFRACLVYNCIHVTRGCYAHLSDAYHARWKLMQLHKLHA